MIIRQKKNAGPDFLMWRACLLLFESQITVQIKLEAFFTLAVLFFWISILLETAYIIFALFYCQSSLPQSCQWHVTIVDIKKSTLAMLFSPPDLFYPDSNAKMAAALIVTLNRFKLDWFIYSFCSWKLKSTKTQMHSSRYQIKYLILTNSML